MKKKFVAPSVLSQVDVGPSGEIIGQGSGQSTPDIVPYSFEIWSVIMMDFPEIYDSDGDGEGGTWADYVKWMTDNNFSEFIDPSEQP